eukprot:jgi/Chlat1/1099/Chrsp110S01588
MATSMASPPPLPPSSSGTGAGSKLAAVTGGAGFLGRHLVAALLAAGWRVRILDLAPSLALSPGHPAADALADALTDGRASYHPCDITADPAAPKGLREALHGVRALFHVASPSTDSRDTDIFRRVNVLGTQNVISACVAEGVAKLVYTSSASVVFNGTVDLELVNESMPYASPSLDAYSASKAEAEALVLAADGRLGLLTCALRPSGIFGEGEPLLVPKAVAAAQAGKLKFVIGDGRNCMDYTYVENVAQAHILAEAALTRPSHDSIEDDTRVSGKAFFITNGEPEPFWDFLYDVVEGLGYPRARMWLPFWLVYGASRAYAWVSEGLLHYFNYHVPTSEFTPARICIMGRSRTFSIERAQKAFGYKPAVPLAEAKRRTIASFSDLKNPNPVSPPPEPSPVKRAFPPSLQHTIYWQRPVDAALLLIAALILFSALRSRSLIVIIARFLLTLVMARLFLTAAVTVFQRIGRGRVVPEFPLLSVSEATVRSSVISCISDINRTLTTLHAVATNPNPLPAVQLVLALYALAAIGKIFSFPALVLLGLFIVMVALPLYESRWQQIHKSTSEILAKVKDALPAARRHVKTS